MKGYSLIIAFLLLLPCINAQYWFQSGARGGQSTQFNSGAQVSIQTVTTQNSQSGSIAYWIGEDLQNGAFLQICIHMHSIHLYRSAKDIFLTGSMNTSLLGTTTISTGQ